MNASESLRTFVGVVSNHPLLARLFFASLEFAALALIVGAALWLSRIKSPRLAAVLWLLVLAKPLASLAIGTPLPIVKFEAQQANLATAQPLPVMQTPQPAPDADAALPDYFPANRQFGRPALAGLDNTDEAAVVVSELPTADPSALTAGTLDPVIPAPLVDRTWLEVNSGRLISTLWIAGSALFLLLALIDRLRTHRLVARAREPDAELSSQYASVGSALGGRRLPRLFETDDLESPALIGTLAPVILIPTWIARDSNRAKLDWALRHELMHWKLFDPIAGLVRELAQILFYFHPVAWWAGRKWEEATELACDRAIVKSAEDSRDYAEQLYGMLVQIRNRRRMPVGNGLFATRTQIGRRIAALLSGPHAAPAHLSALAVAAVLLLSAVTLSIGGTFADKSDKPTETATASASNDSSTDQTPPLDPPVNGGKANSPSPSSGRVGEGAFEVAANEKPPVGAPAEPNNNETITVRGRVLDLDGKPFAGAKVFLLRSSQAEHGNPLPTEILRQVATDKNGLFTISLPDEPQRVLGPADFIDRRYQVVVVGQGHGLDWQAVALGANTPELTLQLVADSSPIEGRVLSLEGRPAAGVRVRAVSISTAALGIDEWIARARKNAKNAPGPLSALSQSAAMDAYYGGRNDSGFPLDKQLTASALPGISDAVTGADGRFKIVGLGSNRLVTLTLQGESTASTYLDAVTHRMEPLPLPMADPRYRTPFYFGAAFDYAAEPTQIVTGIVRDADSGQPLPDVQVEVAQFTQSSFSVPGYLSDTTDAAGRYRIVGLPKRSDAGRPVRLRALPSSSQPYFRTDVNVPNRNELAPVAFDINLKRAVWLKGRLTNKSTGKPVLGLVSYYPFLDNPHALNYSNFSAGILSMGYDDRYATASDGTYKIPAVPGRGVAAAVALDGEVYRVAEGASELEWTTPTRLPGNERRLVFHLIGPAFSNAVRAVDVGEQAGDSTADIDLVPWRQQTIHVKDLAGNPLSGVEVVGTFPMSAVNSTERYNIFGKVLPTASESVVIFGLEPDQQRRVLFLHAEKRIGGSFLIDEKTTEIRLDACATISGRIVDSTGQPLSKQSVGAMIPQSEFPATSGMGEGFGSRAHLVQGASTDDAGRFRFDLIVSGAGYQVNGVAVPVVKPGETIDVGTLTVKDADEGAAAGGRATGSGAAATPKTDPTPPLDPPANGGKTNAPFPSTGRAEVGAVQVASSDNSAAVELAKPQDGDTIVVRGRVLDPDGKPFNGARLFLMRPRTPDHRNAETIESIAVGNSDAAGKFELKLSRSDFDSRFSGVPLVAVADGFGIDWAQLKPGEIPGEVTLKLVEDIPVHGRILDSEGRPVAGAKIGGVRLFGASSGKLDGFLSAWREVADEAYQSIERNVYIPSMSPLLSIAPTDRDGRFEIRGLGQERVAGVLLSAPQIARPQIEVVLRKGFNPKPLNAEVARRWSEMGRPGRPPMLFAPALDFVGEPARTVEGTVRETATGRPVAQALVRGNGGYGGHIASYTDAQGRYQLIGMTTLKPQYTITVEPPYESDMLPRTLSVPNPDGLEPLKADVEVVRGVVITGRVIDRSTGKSVAAHLDAYAIPENDYPDKPRYLGYDLGFYKFTSSADGTFRYVTIPGPSVLVAGVRGEEEIDGMPACPFKLAEFSEDDRKRVVPTANGLGFVAKLRGYAPLHLFHAAKVLDLDEKVGTVECDLFVERGKTTDVIIEDADGKPVTGTIVAGMTAGSSGTHRAKNARCTIYALDPAKRRRVLFIHPERELGGSLVVRGDELQPVTVRLLPTQTLRGRAIDASGHPVAGAIVTPASVGDVAINYLNQYMRLRYERTRTDEDGKFDVKGIISDVSFTLYFQKVRESYIPLQMEDLRRTVTATVNSPGKVIELGDVRLKLQN